MKKYLSITKMVILEKFQYIFNQTIRLTMYAIFIYIFLRLWQYMYTDSDLIAGYTFNQMVWYVAITEILWGGIRPSSIKKDVSNEIRSGKIAYILNKPYNYVGYLIAKYFGEAIVNIAVYVVGGGLISFLLIGKLSTFHLYAIPLIFIVTILAAFITCLIYILISLTSFWIEDSTPIFWIYEKLILCVGVLFPIELFPVILQPFIKFSPIYVTMYAPAKLFVDFSFPVFFEIILFQLGYLLVMSVLCFFVYKKGVKKLNVNGG